MSGRLPFLIAKFFCSRVESNQIDTAIESAQEPEQFFGVLWGVVYTRPTDILKTDTALMVPIILFEQCHHIAQTVVPLCRHNLLTLNAKRVVQRDSQMTFVLIKEPFQSGYDSH